MFPFNKTGNETSCPVLQLARYITLVLSSILYISIQIHAICQAGNEYQGGFLGKL